MDIGIVENEKFFIFDMHSNRKTLAGALKEFARELNKIGYKNLLTSFSNCEGKIDNGYVQETIDWIKTNNFKFDYPDEQRNAYWTVNVDYIDDGLWYLYHSELKED
jgi:hypothetical protein